MTIYRPQILHRKFNSVNDKRFHKHHSTPWQSPPSHTTNPKFVCQKNCVKDPKFREFIGRECMRKRGKVPTKALWGYTEDRTWWSMLATTNYSNSNWYTITKFAISTQRVCTSHTQMSPCTHSLNKINRNLLDRCFGNELQTHCPRGTRFWIKNVTVLAMNHRENASSSSSSSFFFFFFFFISIQIDSLHNTQYKYEKDSGNKQRHMPKYHGILLLLLLLLLRLLPFLLFPQRSYTKPSPETFTNLTLNDIWDSDAIFSSIRLAGDNPRVIQRVTRGNVGINWVEMRPNLRKDFDFDAALQHVTGDKMTIDDVRTCKMNRPDFLPP